MKEKGGEVARTPMVKTPESLILLRVEGHWAEANMAKIRIYPDTTKPAPKRFIDNTSFGGKRSAEPFRCPRSRLYFAPLFRVGDLLQINTIIKIRAVAWIVAYAAFVFVRILKVLPRV